MKNVTIATTLAFASAMVLPLFPSSEAQAASQNECAIWICLPAGFPDGCSAPHKAFLRRLKKGKSPLPGWGSCAVNHPDAPNVDAQADFGADPYIPCEEGYRLIAGFGGPLGGRDFQAAQCVSIETQFSPFGGEIPIDAYNAIPRPNGGRFVTYTVNGSLVYPSDGEGGSLPDARFFY